MSDPQPPEQPPEEPDEDPHARAVRGWRERSAVRNAVVSRAAAPSTPRHARVDEQQALPTRAFTPAPDHLPAPAIDPRTEPMPRLSHNGLPVGVAAATLSRVMIPRPRTAAPVELATEPILTPELVRAIRALSMLPGIALAAEPAAPTPARTPAAALEGPAAAPRTAVAVIAPPPAGATSDLDEPPAAPAPDDEPTGVSGDPAAEVGQDRADETPASDVVSDPGTDLGTDLGTGQTDGPTPPPAKDRKPKAKWPFWIELPVLIVVAFVLTFLIQTFIARVYYVPSGSMEQTLHGSTSGGDRILAFKLVYDFRDPRQGEVVVFKGPDTWAAEADIPGPSSWVGKVGQALGSVIGIAPPNEKDFVKRVIAVGGQTVQCCDAQGRVMVDGVPLNEPYIYEPIDAMAWEAGSVSCKPSPQDPDRYDSQRCFAPFTVPDGEVWVMGDHRSESSDSSYFCLGLTPAGVKDYQDTRADHDACGRPIPVDDVIGKAVFIVMPPSRWGTIGSPDIMNSAAGVSAGALSHLSSLPAIAPASLGVIGAAGLWGMARFARRGRRRKPQ